MTRKDKKRNAEHRAAMAAKKSGTSENFTKEIPANTPPKGFERDFEATGFLSLDPVLPNPAKGFERLSPYMVEFITKATMKYMKQLAYDRHTPLDLKYWEKFTRSVLEQPNTDIAIICSAPAGGGKSTWILSFLRALKKLFFDKSEFDSSIIGVTVVLQKVEDLNVLAEELNRDCPPDAPFMVALQGWSESGKNRGFCQNAGVDCYDACPRGRCPYAAQCPILAFRETAPYAPVIGLTQERFYILRESGLTLIRYRMGQDGIPRPRRYFLFDEKFQMAPVIALSAKQLNDASTAFNDAIQKYGAVDASVRAYQQRLYYTVMRFFQNIRKAQQTEDGRDIPVGFLRLTEDEQEGRQAYDEFKESILAKKGRFTSKPLSAVFSVMDYLYDGGTALFTKGNGFCIYRIDPPQLHFGDCQTIIFDATAEVDKDYSCLGNVEILPGTPKSKARTVNFHVHTHPIMNVTKTAMDNPWKLPAFAKYIAGLIRNSDKPVFLCTYQRIAVDLANQLKEHLSESEFNKILRMLVRGEPTLPYFFGRNGSNSFKDAELVIILGYPWLNPPTYLSLACAAFGSERIATELNEIPVEKRLGPNFSALDLPSVRDYVSHHLAARLEQEIYRCAQRNPGFTGEITIHLFYPPKDVLDILRERIPCEVIYDDELPECFARWKGMARQYKGDNTGFGRLRQFLETWDGAPLRVTEIQVRLGISRSVWSDLIADSRVKSLLEEFGVQRTGRGPNAQWSIPAEDCAAGDCA